ncbi:mitochondrial import receptor subunit TOM20 homolog B-like [Zeugodacus cucurbitae]|uniref:Mitochondrial import receptor subunit TOM20 homolog B n=1 Tax=Zeugodacus cucurbitae TaxID=28588 RepID=A0A0A1WSF0_ZEUCU|nr:mitochondrial import receptor subunit TOM20 homolog B-like [Zeugodacus cucurbitae]
MNTLNKTTVGIAAGVAGTLFLGYCIYFDRKRRADPEYKLKVHERRRRNRKHQNAARNASLNDYEALQRYFAQEINMGETLIGQGEFENGVAHFVNALGVCEQPTRILGFFQATLSPQVFAMLIIKLQEFSNRANAETNGVPKVGSANSIDSDGKPVCFVDGTPSTILIDDLE